VFYDFEQEKLVFQILLLHHYSQDLCQQNGIYVLFGEFKTYGVLLIMLSFECRKQKTALEEL